MTPPTPKSGAEAVPTVIRYHTWINNGAKTCVSSEDFDRQSAELAQAEKSRVGWMKRSTHFEEKHKQAEAELAQAREDHGHACELVAKMHAAAVGEVTGPKRGVVEDVEDLRAALIALRAERGQAEVGGTETKAASTSTKT